MDNLKEKCLTFYGLLNLIKIHSIRFDENFVDVEHYQVKVFWAKTDFSINRFRATQNIELSPLEAGQSENIKREIVIYRIAASLTNHSDRQVARLDNPDLVGSEAYSQALKKIKTGDWYV